MEDIYAFLSIISGLIVRLGLPIGVTAIAIFLLRRLDNHWKKEAADSLNKPRVQSTSEPCWEVNQCSEEKRENCLAVQNPNTPCWQLFRNNQGILKEECLGCDVFRLAPIPVIGD